MGRTLNPNTLVIAIGAVLWVVVTIAGAVVVVQAPAEHAELGLFLVLMWVVLIGFAALARLYEWLSGRLR